MRMYGCLVPAQLRPGTALSRALLQQVADDIRRTGMLAGCPAGEPLVTSTGVFGWLDVPDQDPPQQGPDEYEADLRENGRSLE